jgi:hypothetical protein
MKTALVLEDDQKRVINFKRRFVGLIMADFVETVDDALKLLKESTFDFLFLDHDLGGEAFVDPRRRDTGSEVARWISKNPLPNTQVFIHSLNHLVVEDMAKLIPGSIIAPCVWLDVEFEGHVGRFLPE